MEDNNIYVGIDLGTTNSVIATVNKKYNGDVVSAIVDIPRPKEIYQTSFGKSKFSTAREHTLPSLVYYRDEEDFKPVVGDVAKTVYPMRPYLVAKSIKSQMSNPTVMGLSENVRDKTPSKVASRILEHMLFEFAKQYRIKNIKDAVITVPANFNPAMCKATLEAAEFAGLETKYPDGTDKPMLLSEPDAVIYDLYNQIKNGTISGELMNFNKKQNVIVFDLGGGTLDITMHIIKPSDNEVMEIEEIATNRYTLLGGDDFDKVLAEAMFTRYLSQYEKHPDVIQNMYRDKSKIMPELLRYAEVLKLCANDEFSNEETAFSGWDDSDDNASIDAGGNMNNGYSYDDIFYKDDIENIYSDLMGRDLRFEDYKRIDSIENKRNIIFPILDVLSKAEKIIGEENLRVDNVILNGGMSKFYMIRDRIEEFFGFKPLTTMDPDLSVARGAAIYHYTLLNRNDIKEHMSAVSVDTKKDDNPKEFIKENNKIVDNTADSDNDYGIKFGKRKLNESLYLGLKNGTTEKIIPAGSSIPFQSEQKKGFKIEPKQSRIAIPIKTKNIDGEYVTIANGNIFFKTFYPRGAYVSFILTMNENKIITMNAWTSNDIDCENVIERGSCSIDIEDFAESNKKNKLVSASGNSLNAKGEINFILQMCGNYINTKDSHKRADINNKIKLSTSNILKASNKEDFAEPILESLNSNLYADVDLRLFVIARKIAHTWTDENRRVLARRCISKLSVEFEGFSCKTFEKNRNSEIIKTLSVCGSDSDIKKLEAIHDKSHYRNSCIYTYAIQRKGLKHLNKWLKEDIENAVKFASKPNHLQETAYFTGIAYRKDIDQALQSPSEKECLKKLIYAVNSGKLKNAALISSIIAIGFISDQRFNNILPSEIINEAYKCIDQVEYIYNPSELTNTEKPIMLVKKMISGESLLEDEEKFLLGKIDN